MRETGGAVSDTERASDRYLTTGKPLRVLRLMWPDGADLDPFHDPARPDPLGRRLYDLRLGDDAYALSWGGAGERVWVNGPYSQGNPGRTAARCDLHAALGVEILNLCPAAPGSVYWIEHVWPSVSAVAWCGRETFRAGVDMHDKDGRLICAAGEEKGGNRTEIALLYYGPDVERFLHVSQVVAGWPTQRIR